MVRKLVPQRRRALRPTSMQARSSSHVSQKNVDSGPGNTMNRNYDFLPLKRVYKLPGPNLSSSALSASRIPKLTAMIARTETTTTRATGAHVYKAGLFWDFVPCASVGFEYTIRTDDLTTNKLSNEFVPQAVFDFTKDCGKPRHKADRAVVPDRAESVYQA